MTCYFTRHRRTAVVAFWHEADGGSGSPVTVEPTWFDRDLPVLETVIQLLEELGRPGAFVQVQQIAERSGIDAHTVLAALAAMEHTYVTLNLVLAGGNPNPQMVSGVTAAARRAVGQWPSPESMTDRLLAALDSAAEQEEDPARKSRLRSAADAVAGIGRDVLVNVITAAATGAIPHH